MNNPFTARMQRTEMDRLGRSVLAEQYEKKSWSGLNQFFEHIEGVDSAGKRGLGSQLQEYRSWIYDIVNAIQRRVVSIPRHLKLKGKETEIETHPILDLLEKPNQFITGRFLMQFCQMSMDLTGKMWIMIMRDNFGFPYELWPFTPNTFLRFDQGKTNRDFLKGFYFRTGDSDEKFYKIEDVIYQHYPHPEDLIDGMSPVQAQAYATDIDHYIEVYERGFFKQSARPDIVFESTDDDMQDEERGRFRDSWNKMHAGESRQHRAAILPKGMKAHVFSVSAKDFAFMELAQWSKDKLFGAYSTPEIVVGHHKNANRASSFIAHVSWNENCIEPRLKLWEEIETRLAQEWDDRLYIEYDSPIPRDKEFSLKEATEKIGKGIWTPDEARIEDGLDPRGGMAAELYMPSTLTPITFDKHDPPDPKPEPEPNELDDSEEIPEEPEGGGGEGEPAAEEEGKTTNAIEVLKNRYIGDDPEKQAEYEEIKEEDVNERESNQSIDNLSAKEPNPSIDPVSQDGVKFRLPEIPKTEEEKENYWKQYVYRTDREERAFRDATREFFRSQEDAQLGRIKVYWPRKEAEFNGWSIGKVKSALEKSPAIINEMLLDEDEQAKIMQNHLRPLYTKIVEDHGEAQIQSFQIGMRFDVDSPEAQEWIAKHSLLACKTIQSTHFDNLRWVLNNGLVEGLSMDQIAKGIRDVYKQQSAYNALRIARTEVINASNRGLVESWDQINQMTGETVVHAKEWLVSADSRLCERCAPMNGAIVPLDGKFEEAFKGETITYEHPTLHPS